MAAVTAEAKENPTAVAVPIQPVAVPMATAVVVPVKPQPVMQLADNFTFGQGYTPIVPAEHWKTGLCDTGEPCGMCCPAFWCAFITGPQLYEKVLGRTGACSKWMAILLVLFVLRLLGTLLLYLSPQSTDSGEVRWNSTSESSSEIEGCEIEGCESIPMGLVWYGLGAVGSIGFLIVLTNVLVAVRKRVREKDRIRPASCGDNEDCCCSFFFGCCVMLQLFHHLGISQSTGYQLCHPEGIPTTSNLPQVSV